MEVAVNLHLENGECPVWNPVDRHLYWADIPAGTMYRFNPQSGGCERLYEAGQQIGGLVVEEDGAIVQFLENGRVQIWDAGNVTLLIDKIPEEVGRRFNDATVDPRGRVLAGTMADSKGKARLYVFDTNGEWRVLLDDIGQSNGMAFSREGDILFHTDTGNKRLSRYKYDPERGVIEGGETIVQLDPDGDPVPDGLTIDAEGNLWSAHWGGSCVQRYTSSGEGLETLHMPTNDISSVEFGGDSFQHLFITAAGGDRQPDTLAGGLFRADVGVAGLPPRLSRLRRPTGE